MKDTVKMLGLVVAVAPLVALAKPMIDGAHDRVQTTLDPQMDRIGTLTPRSAREIGPRQSQGGDDPGRRSVL